MSFVLKTVAFVDGRLTEGHFVHKTAAFVYGWHSEGHFVHKTAAFVYGRLTEGHFVHKTAAFVYGWPMIVVRSRKKDAYLEALHRADLIVGDSPSDGAHAELNDPRRDLCTASRRDRHQYVSRSKDSEVPSNERICRTP